MYELLFPILISLASGFALIWLLWPAHKPNFPALFLRICLSLGVGFGMSSCGFFLWLVFFGPPGSVFITVETAVLFGLIGVIALWRRRSAPPPDRDVNRPSALMPRMRATVLTGFLILLLSGMVAFTMLASLEPHGDWDAWVSWNLRARFLFGAGDQWQRAFSPLTPRACPGYPVFLSGLVARSWKYAGTASPLVPVVVAALFTFGAVGLVFSALHVLRGRTQALLAGAVLLGTPFLLLHGVSQYADVPIAFFFLATIVLLTLSSRLRDARYGLLALAGLMCGLAVYTKHEGLLFLLGLTVVGIVSLVRADDRKACLKRLGAFVAGAAVPLILFIYVKAAMAPGTNYMVAALTGEAVLRRLAEPWRYVTVIWALLEQAFKVQKWCALPVVLPFYLLLTGTQVDERDRAGFSTALWLLAFMLFGHFVMFLITHDNLEWHVKWSLDRLLLQLWPAAVFLLFLVARKPEETAVGDSDAHG